MLRYGTTTNNNRKQERMNDIGRSTSNSYFEFFTRQKLCISIQRRKIKFNSEKHASMADKTEGWRNNKKRNFQDQKYKNNVGIHNKGLYQALIWSIWWIYKCIWILKVDYWPGILPFREHSKNWWSWKLCSPFIEILQLLIQLLTTQLFNKW